MILEMTYRTVVDITVGVSQKLPKSMVHTPPPSIAMELRKLLIGSGVIFLVQGQG